MARDGRRSLGSNGDGSELPQKFKPDAKGPSTGARILTVIAYIISVSTAAALLSAYYVFLWVPQPTDSIRPTDSPFSLAQHGNNYGAGSSYHHYPKNTYSNPMDSSKHAPSNPRGSKKAHHYKSTVPPNFLPKPQYLVRNKKGMRPTYQTTTPNPST